MTPALSQSLSSAARHAPSATVAAFLKRRHQLLIDGTWTESTDGGVIAVFDPATEAQISTVSAAGTADVDRAVAAARRAFDGGPWRELSGAGLAKLIWATGRSARGLRTATLFGGLATKLKGVSANIGDPAEDPALTTREPVGMVAGSSPRISPDHGGDEASAGAKPVAGGGRAADLGYFIQPTVLTQANPSVKILDEEVFGQALSVLAFAKEALEDIAAWANRRRYGRRPASEPSMAERCIGWARLSGQVWIQGGRRFVGAMS